MSIVERQFVVVHNSSHSGEFHFTAFGDVVVLEMGFKEEAVFADDLTESSEESLQFLGVGGGAGGGFA